MNSLAKQKGVALFITLLVISIATLLATEMWFNNKIDIAKQMNNRAFLQSEHYAQGMVLWAKDVLRKDAESQASFDNRSEIWNQTINGIQLEDAMLSGNLIEMDSKFNLNNLVNATGEVADQVDYFKRLLSNLDLELAISDRIIDWIDANSEAKPQGAEDLTYLSRPPYYRTPGQALTHLSELRLIEGIDESTYQRLKQYVTVIPKSLNSPETKININLASTVVLKSLLPEFTTQDAIALYNEGNAAHQTLDDFFNQGVVQYHLPGNNNPERARLRAMIDTQSVWFQAQVNVNMEQSYFQKYALLKRTGTSTAIQIWSQTPFN
jgi:general secretion pathway protein K